METRWKHNSHLVGRVVHIAGGNLILSVSLLSFGDPIANLIHLLHLR